MLKESTSAPELRAELARLYLWYGFAASGIGENPTDIVLPAYDAALAIQQQLVKEQPENRSFRADLGWTMIYAKLWHNPLGFRIYQPQAIAIFERLALEDPGDPFARLGLVWALGLGEFKSLDTPEKVAMSERRLTLLEQLLKEYPQSAEIRRDLATQLAAYPVPGENASDSRAKLVRISRANELRAGYLAALERLDPAARTPLHPRDSGSRTLRPTVVYGKFDLANGWRVESQVLAQLKRWPESGSFADRATDLSRGLLEENPSVKTFAGLLSLCFSNRVEVAEKSGDQTGAQVHRLEADNFWRTHPSIERLDGFYQPAKSEAVKTKEIKEQSP